MFIALSLKYFGAPAERHVLGVFSYMPLLKERGYFILLIAINILLLRSKNQNN